MVAGTCPLVSELFFLLPLGKTSSSTSSASLLTPLQLSILFSTSTPNWPSPAPPMLPYGSVPHDYRMPPHGQRKCARAFFPLLVWIWVAISLLRGYYGKHRLVLGPNSSRMLKTSSLFVKQVQVKDKANQGILLYGFKERPELSLETNWTVSKHLFVDSYERRGFSMWLNKGSRIRMTRELNHGDGSYEDAPVVLIKGEENLEELRRYHPTSEGHSGDTGDGDIRETEYTIAEDDSYYFGVVNLTPRTLVITMKVNVTSKIYDVSRANNICATTDGLCKLDLHLPSTFYYVLTTPGHNVPLAVQAELSFVARMVSYLLITGLVIGIVYMILKSLGACDSEQTSQEQVETVATETDPILPRKEISCTYGTTREEPESSLPCTSEDLYDGKICVICYDERRNCFFTPCGHNATCYTCAMRIMEEENKVCPICRRLIHRLRRLSSPSNDPQSASVEGEEKI